LSSRFKISGRGKMTRRVTLNMREEVFEELRRLAQAHRMSFSAFVTKALEELVIEGKRRAGMELLRLIEGGGMVSDEAEAELERMRGEEWGR